MARRRGPFAGPWVSGHTDALHACWRGRSIGPIFDHREAAVGVCRLPRTVCESAGERWRDGAGRLPDLGYPVTPMLCMHGRATRPILDHR
jgi:hypothetical protein